MIASRTYTLLALLFCFTLTACDGLFADLSELEAPDFDADMADVPCEPETNTEFCERLGHECGAVTDVDNCGGARSIDCDDYGDFGCGQEGVCLLASSITALESNVCDCPDVDFEASTETICGALEAECDDIEPAQICGYAWRDHATVECGECPDGEECGVIGPNVCGCPCAIDEGCQFENEASPDNPCLICDPSVSREEFTVADDWVVCADNAFCMDGTCQCDEDGGFSECGDRCVDLNSDPDHCGSCSDSCQSDVDGATVICVDGNCEIECPDPVETYCDDLDLCVNLDFDDDHCGVCGTQCLEGESCVEGACDCTEEGYAECDDKCVDTMSDPNHCGECGESCDGDFFCISGLCEADCSDPMTVCDTYCVDTTTNPNYCGNCDNTCESDELCVDSECVDCEDNDDCDGDEVCNTASNECVECVNDGDCYEDAICSEDNECVCRPSAYIISSGGLAQEIDSDGNLVWTFDAESQLSGIAVDSQGYLYISASNQFIYRLDHDGQIDWSFNLSDVTNSRATDVAVDSEGFVYAATDQNQILKIDPSQDEVIWNVAAHGNSQVRDIAVDHDGFVYSAGFDGVVRKGNPDGSEVWTFEEHGGSVGRIAVDRDGFVYSASADQTARKISPDGQEVWRFTGHNSPVTGIAVDAGGFVYTASSNGSVRKLNSNSSQQWKFDEHDYPVDTLAVDDAGFVYAAYWDGSVIKLNPDGNKEWRFEATTDALYGVAVDPGLYATYDELCQPVVD